MAMSFVVRTQPVVASVVDATCTDLIDGSLL